MGAILSINQYYVHEELVSTRCKIFSFFFLKKNITEVTDNSANQQGSA